MFSPQQSFKVPDYGIQFPDKIEVILLQPSPSFIEWITVIGVILTLLIGFINIIVAINRNRMDGVTNNRVIWIQSVRETIAKLSALTPEESVSEFNKLAYILSAYLNPTGQFDHVIMDFLVDLAKARAEDQNALNIRRLTECRNIFLLACQIYLKAEWDRVKWENKVIKCGKYKEKKRINKLLKSFNEKNAYVKAVKERYELYCENDIVSPSFLESV